jgi:hypothetical protein
MTGSRRAFADDNDNSPSIRAFLFAVLNKKTDIDILAGINVTAIRDLWATFPLESSPHSIFVPMMLVNFPSTI